MIKRDPNCTRCKLHQTAEFVCLLGNGPEPSEVMIVGEAPGAREDDSGKPFVGSSGKLLEQALDKVGIKRKNVFITNAVSCRPPENRTPKTGEIKACRFWFQAQFSAIKPKYVLLLGNVPLQSVLDLKGIKKLRGKPIERDGIIYLPTYHPSFILRDPRQRDTFEADLSLFAEIIEKGEIPKEKDLRLRVVNNRNDVDDFLDDLWGKCSFDIETTCLYPWAKEARINSIGFGTRKTQWAIPWDHEEGRLSETTKDYILEVIEKRIENGELFLIAQNGKFDSLWVWVHTRRRLRIWFDTMVAHYLLDENSLHGLKHLSRVFFGALDYDVDNDTKTGKKGFEPMAYYQAHDLLYTRNLWKIFTKKLDKDPEIRQVFDLIMMPCVNLFTEIEYRGVYINTEKMVEVERYLRKLKNEAEKELNSYLPEGYEDINWGSTKQLGHLLFEVLKIPIVEYTKKGSPSTSESVIKRLDHPLVEALLRFRGAKQQLSFFIDGWKPYLVNKRLHPSFKLTGTVTGRLSCENPNLQQVPRDPVIRSLIGAPPGWQLIEADLSQIELRIAAELSGDQGLSYAFLHGIDPHWLTAIREIERSGALPELVFKTARSLGVKTNNYGEAIKAVLDAGSEKCESIDYVWKELRKKAKAINFGYLYGMWWKKFKTYARDNYGVTITDEQAEASRKFFFDEYDGLPEWHKRQKKFARNNGYVRSLSGRKRRLPDAMSQHDTPERGSAERQAINSPVQSFANELNLMALLQLRSEFSPRVLQPVGTVHDAILMEVRDEYVEEVYNRILEIMSHPELLDTFEIRMRIPLEADAKIGPWGTGVNLTKWLRSHS